MQLMNKKNIIIATGVISLLVLTLVALFIYNTQTVQINVAPESAKITLDGKVITNDSRQWVKQGSHSVTISADGFTPLTEDLSAQGVQETNYLFCLKPETSEARTTISNRRNSTICEGADGNHLTELSRIVHAKNPFLSDLPFNEGLFSIGQGLSQKDPKNPQSFGVYVHYYNDASLVDAKKWLSSKTDINKLEVIYSKDYSDSRQTGGDRTPQYADLLANFPNVKNLPFKDPYYTISYRSLNSKDLRIVILTSSPRYRYVALNQLRSLGFKPEDYIVEFADFVNPLEKDLK